MIPRIDLLDIVDAQQLRFVLTMLVQITLILTVSLIPASLARRRPTAVYACCLYGLIAALLMPGLALAVRYSGAEPIELGLLGFSSDDPVVAETAHPGGGIAAVDDSTIHDSREPFARDGGIEALGDDVQPSAVSSTAPAGSTHNLLRESEPRTT